MAKKKFKRNNKYFIGGLVDKFGDWNKSVTDDLMGSSLGKGLGKLGVSSSGLGGIANTAATAIGGLLAGGNESGVGNALQGIGSLASNIPGIGGVIGAGVNLVGGVVNAAFGSKLNKEEIAKVEGQINNLNSFTSNASDYDSLASNYTNMPAMGYFSRDDIGSDGWFSNKAKNKWKELRKEKELAEQWVQNSLFNNAQNIATNKQQSLEANYAAYGGPINMEYTGVMSPFGNQFDEGGSLDTRMKLLRRLEEKRNRRGTYGRGKHGGGGAGSLFLESPDDFTLVKDTIWVPYRETFNEAFRRADNAGLKEFMFDGMPYTTEKGDNPNNNKAGEERVIEGLLPVERTRKVKNKKAEGGNLFSNGVTIIGNGDTHENNPLEGVPMGIDNQGIPNLVEEGEVIFNDYVFSNRLRVPKAVRQKYKLRGITFADAAEDVQKESEERPNDPISKNGLEAFMQILMNEQEMVRAKKESNKYAKGGRLCNKFYNAGPIEIIDFPYSVYSSRPKDDFDFSKWFTVDKNNLGKVTDYTDAYRNYKFTADKAREWAKLFGNDESLKSYLAKGNKLEDLTDEDVQKGSLDGKHGWLHKARAMMANLDNANTVDIDNIFKGLDNTPFKPLSIKNIPIEIEDNIGELPEEKVKEIAPMKNNWLRYAPIIGNGMAVINDWFGGNEPDYSNADLFADAIRGTNRQIGYRPIGNYLRYTPLDREFYLNKLDANTAAGRRAVMNTSGGNRAAALAGILATDYNYGNQLGDLARKAEEYNLDQRHKVEDFNRATNMFNSEMGTKVDMFNAEQDMQRARMYGNLAEYRDKILAANRAEKSANLTNFIQGLGGLGREITDRDKLRWLTEKGVLKSADGGKINRRKKRGGFTI